MLLQAGLPQLLVHQLLVHLVAFLYWRNGGRQATVASITVSLSCSHDSDFLTKVSSNNISGSPASGLDDISWGPGSCASIMVPMSARERHFLVGGHLSSAAISQPEAFKMRTQKQPSSQRQSCVETSQYETATLLENFPKHVRHAKSKMAFLHTGTSKDRGQINIVVIINSQLHKMLHYCYGSIHRPRHETIIFLCEG